MPQAIIAFFLVFIFAIISGMQWNLDADKTSTRQLKNTLELAVHDATLAIDESQLAQGFIVFDQLQARVNFKESMKYHLKLDDSYVPLEESFYTHPFEVKSIEFIDYSTIGRKIDKDNPYVYEHDTYDIVEILNGASVIVVVETQSPRYFSGPDSTIRQAAVYEYEN